MLSKYNKTFIFVFINAIIDIFFCLLEKLIIIINKVIEAFNLKYGLDFKLKYKHYFLSDMYIIIKKF